MDMKSLWIENVRDGAERPRNRRKKGEAGVNRLKSLASMERTKF